MKQTDLTLPDFLGCIREAKPGHLFPPVISKDRPFSALLRKAQKPTAMRAGELIVIKTDAPLFGPEGAAHMRFLRQQFPSLHRRYRKGSKKNSHWWLNDKDYALMRTFFGGAG